jgi:hypothetical protein
MNNATIKSVVMGLGAIAFASSVQAQFAPGSSSGLNSDNDVYNTLTIPSGATPAAVLPMNNGDELGNEIFMPNNPNDNYITNFQFEYYGSSTGSGTTSDGSFAGNVQVQINFYLNNGPTINGYASPGTLIWHYDTTPFTGGGAVSAVGTGTAQLFIVGLNDPAGISGGSSYLDGINVPYTFGGSGQEITYTISFTGLGSGDLIGLDAVGGSYPTLGGGTVVSGYWYKPSGSSSFEYLFNATNSNVASMAEIQAVPEPTSLTVIGVSGLALLAGVKRRFAK